MTPTPSLRVPGGALCSLEQRSRVANLSRPASSGERPNRPPAFGRPRSAMQRRLLWIGFVLACLAAAAAGFACAGESLLLYSQAQVDSQGIFLAQLVAGNPARPLPHLRLADAPPFGRVLLVSQEQLAQLLQKTAPDLLPAQWSGARQVRIVRRARSLGEEELKQQLAQVLQHEIVRDRGELELRFARPWQPVVAPDEPWTLKVINLPSSGMTSHGVVSFELATPAETIGRWHVPVQARVWREIVVARVALKAGDLFQPDQVTRERRDILGLHDAPLLLAADAPALEVTEMVPAGAPVYARSVRARPVVRRGQIVDAQFRDGPMMIVLKVEVLENGAPGQQVRVRNTDSRREFRGRVADEQTVLVSL